MSQGITIQAGAGAVSPEELVDAAEMAIEAEIEAVRERPSNDVLTGGKKVKSPSEDEVHYHFDTTNPSLRFAEECKATLPGETVTICPVEVGEEAMVFRFPKDFGETIPEVELEWENDFVLKRIREALAGVLSSEERRRRIKRMMRPAEYVVSAAGSAGEESGTGGDAGGSDAGGSDAGTSAGQAEDTGNAVRHFGKTQIHEDGLRNEAQRQSMEKALKQPVSYIWGPPGTGKTATLAYIITNFVMAGKSVLFVSNTNRAVDHGMLGVMEAMETLGLKAVNRRITRFGERVLESKRLDSIHFEQQLEESLREQMQEAADLQNWLDALDLPDLTPAQKQHIWKKIERLGGKEAVEEQIRELSQKDRYAFNRLRAFKVVGTTLARVCTSDMLEQMEFDAVVVDEASMAGIPYMLVMATKAKEHLVIVGDPMQLPPIAVTTDIPSRNILEQDIFATVSGAGSTDELFMWHDHNPAYTSFFNIQYRMQSDLARVISDVFYEGRLESAGTGPQDRKVTAQGNASYDMRAPGDLSPEPGPESVVLLDTSAMQPVLRQDGKRRGFQPVNDVHTELLADLVRRQLTEMYTGLNEIGIIVPFRSAVWHLRRELRGKNRWYDLEIGTIHTFQGREKKVIILDTVMTGEPRNGSVQHYSVRPFDEAKNGLSVPRLLNVAFSRSRERMIVLADMSHIRRVYGRKFLGKLLGRLPVRSV
ncbi:AAA domain-containing protein [Balneolales bacterium ANBcel1]|nr:AAA domain-containing protein [Balneolales bacterium ANBcel1]